MYSTPTRKEVTVFKQHLIRLHVLVVSCSILAASFAPTALAALKGK